jgi:hypothetical protein
MRRIPFDFAGTPFALETDRDALAEHWIRLYRHFLPAEAGEALRPTWRVVRDGASWHYTPPDAGRTWPLWPRLEMAADTVFHDALTRIPGHLMFHAGALAGEAGEGVILVGESHHGKSTLTLALMLSGYHFFSDEVAAVRLADGMLHPFPRALSLRDGTIALLGLAGQRAASGYAGSPWMVDAEQLRPGSAAGVAVPLRHIFFLHDPEREMPEVRSHHFLMTGVSADWPDTLSSLQGVRLSRFGREGVLGSADLSFDDSVAFARFEQHQRQQQILTLSISATHLHQPTFRGPVRVHPLTAPDAALRLWPHLHNGLHSPVVAGAGQGDPRPLLRTTMRVLSGVACHELHLGPLQEMVAAVREIVSQSTGSPVNGIHRLLQKTG